APNAPNVWHLTGTNAGDVQTLTVQNQAQGTVAFANVENLTGGQSSDVFYVKAAGLLTGSLNGGSGPASDRLDYSGLTTDVRVDLLAGQATKVLGGVTNIEN